MREIVRREPLADLIERERRSRAQADADLPMMQIEIGGGVTLNIMPGDKAAFMAGTIVEGAGRKAIAQKDIEHAARILHAAPTTTLSGQLHNVVISYAVAIITAWHPRLMKRFLDDLERDPDATVARYENDPFAMAWLAELRRDVVIDPTDLGLDTRKQLVRAIRVAREGLGDMLHQRRDLAGSFWIEVARLARHHGCDMKLPARDLGRGGASSTALFELAVLLRDLLVARGRMLLPQYQDGRAKPGAGDRFARLAAMRRAAIISNLEQAKRKIREQAQ